MNKWAIIYILRLLAERLIGAVLFWMGAGRFDFRSGIFFAVYVLVAIVSGIIIPRNGIKSCFWFSGFLLSLSFILPREKLFLSEKRLILIMLWE